MVLYVMICAVRRRGRFFFLPRIRVHQFAVETIRRSSDLCGPAKGIQQCTSIMQECYMDGWDGSSAVQLVKTFCNAAVV